MAITLNGTTGIVTPDVNSTGGLTVDNDGATVATFDRATSNGTIVDLQKSSTSIGTLGVRSAGVGLSVNSANSDLALGRSGNELVYLGNSTMYPGTSGGIGLGTAFNKFSDVYLSGGVYLGGTGAANYLDDYEEGTWTPSIRFGGGNTGITHGNQNGRYTKIGNRVTATCYVQLTNKGSSSGNASIEGLPFASQSGSLYYTNAAIWANSLSGISGSLQAYNTAGSAAISEITYLGTGTVTPVTNTNCANTTDFMILISYPTDS